VETLRVILFVLLAALAAVGGWLAYVASTGSQPIPGILGASTVWDVSGSNPLVIGSASDPFVYAGGTGIQTASGTIHVTSTASGSGTLEVSLRGKPGAWGSLTASNATDLRLTASLGGEVWTDVDVDGNTGRGDTRLPTTHALIGGMAQFETGTSGSTWSGLWTIAQAVRKIDGSIRQNGLVFSPLLRDKKGFADPSRVEWTILLYGAATDSELPVVLQVVFQDVTFTTVPAGVTPP
jgi:hypothetical protein